MKRFCLLLALLLLPISLAGCSAGEGSNLPPAEESAAPSADAVVSEAEYLPDFTVQLIDGSSFRLFEALEDHELVLIHLFASECASCAAAFPSLQEAWTQNADRVAVLALSVEPEDSDEVLRRYAEELSLGFPIGREAGTDLKRFASLGCPVSLLVRDKGRVAAAAVGAILTPDELQDWFDSHSGERFDPFRCSCTVFAYGADRDEIMEGVLFNFCTDTSCTPLGTDETGKAVFTGAPARYHVQIIKEPEGWQPDWGYDWYTGPFDQIFWIPFSEVGQ